MIEKLVPELHLQMVLFWMNSVSEQIKHHFQWQTCPFLVLIRCQFNALCGKFVKYNNNSWLNFISAEKLKVKNSYDYDTVLQYSNLFYQAQRSGKRDFIIEKQLARYFVICSEDLSNPLPFMQLKYSTLFLNQ